MTDGDWIEVYNMFGEARFKAEITPVIKPGILNCAHGWWFPEQDGEEPNLFGVWKSNFNSLVPHQNIGKLGFGAPYKGVMCNIRRVHSLPLEQFGIKEVQVGPFKKGEGNDGDAWEWFYIPCPTSIFSEHWGTNGDKAGQRPLAVQVDESASMYYGTVEEMVAKMAEFDRPMVLFQL